MSKIYKRRPSPPQYSQTWNNAEFAAVEASQSFGSWTPSIGGTATYGPVFGTYYKIGKLVWVGMDMTISVLGTGSQNVISGLPFISTAAGYPRAGDVAYFTGLAMSVVLVNAYVNDAASTIVLASMTAASTTVAGNAILTSGTRIVLSAVYEAAN